MDAALPPLIQALLQPHCYAHPVAQVELIQTHISWVFITDRFAYSAYGQLLSRAGVTRTPYKWLGGLAVRAEGDGLYHMRNRHYSADLRRFISADPSGLGGGPNLYAYCLGNPLAYIDPLGLCASGYDQYGSTISTDASFASSHHYNDVMYDPGSNPSTRALMQVDSLVPDGAVGTTVGDNMAASMAFNTFTAPAISFATVAVGSWVGRLFGNGVVETTALSPYRMTTAGEAFYHYGYAENAASFESGLRPGGFATSVEGLSGAGAQSGLALPRPTAPPNAVYTVTPQPGTWMRVNPITEPQFGQSGGLPEFQFLYGTGPGTVSSPMPIRPR